jgi:multidrug efflux system outer membrane protein
MTRLMPLDIGQGLFAIFFALLLFGCTVGPDYQRAPLASSARWKEAAPNEKWKTAEPRDDVRKGSWWGVFHSPELDRLEAAALAYNQNVRAAYARVNQARSTARVAESDLFPTVNLDPSAQRMRGDPHAFGSPKYPYPAFTLTDYKVPFDLSYELDLWGKIRRSFEAATAAAQSSFADYYSVLLIMQADVAQNYFSLRALDGEHIIFAETIEVRQKNLDLVQQRFSEGLSPELDLAQAKADLASVQARSVDVDIRRAEVEHALAVLTGRPPAALSLSRKAIGSSLPRIPPGLPSALLERRPDVARQERLVAAANARIGVAKSAFFPSVKLTGSLGFESTDVSNLITWGSKSWGIGPSVSIPLFEGGRLLANLRGTKAGYEEAVANYRQEALVAFQDVEDALSGLRLLEVKASAVDREVAAAARAAELSRDRYRDGLVSYLQVLDAERELLEARRSATQLEGQRFVLTVLLIKALGGGW